MRVPFVRSIEKIGDEWRARWIDPYGLHGLNPSKSAKLKKNDKGEIRWVQAPFREWAEHAVGGFDLLTDAYVLKLRRGRGQAIRVSQLRLNALRAEVHRNEDGSVAYADLSFGKDKAQILYHRENGKISTFAADRVARGADGKPSPKADAQPQVVYSFSGKLLTAVDVDKSHANRFTYPEKPNEHLLISVTGMNGDDQKSVYDENGRIISTMVRNTETIKVSYAADLSQFKVGGAVVKLDSLGRPLEVASPGNASIAWTIFSRPLIATEPVETIAKNGLPNASSNVLRKRTFEYEYDGKVRAVPTK